MAVFFKIRSRLAISTSGWKSLGFWASLQLPLVSVDGCFLLILGVGCLLLLSPISWSLLTLRVSWPLDCLFTLFDACLFTLALGSCVCFPNELERTERPPRFLGSSLRCLARYTSSATSGAARFSFPLVGTNSIQFNSFICDQDGPRWRLKMVFTEKMC